MTSTSTLNFLTKEFFEKSLKNGFQDNSVQIEDVKVSVASSNGENFASTIYSAEINYKQSNGDSKKIKLIVKSMDPNDNESPVQRYNGFQKEVTMYTTIIPKIEQLYGNKETFAPKYFYSDSDVNRQNIVLEDLSPLGYTLADRVKQLDEVHTKIVLQKLGRYHAGAIVLSQQEPSLFKMFDKGFYGEETFDMTLFQNIYLHGIKEIIELISDWDGFEVITEKLKKISKRFRQILTEFFTPKSNEIRVLNHADLWTNNIMFKYDGGDISSVKFIDLQCSNGSIAMDIHCFLNTSVAFNVLQEKREELLRHYYDSFRKGLEELNYSKIPSWENIQDEIKNKEFFGFMVLTGETPIAILGRDEAHDTSFETILDTCALGKKRAITYSKPEYQNFLKHSLKRLNDLGTFDDFNK